MVKKVGQSKAGRPVTIGATVATAMRLPLALIEAIDKWAEAAGVGRSEAMRRLIELGLTVKRRGRS